MRRVVITGMGCVTPYGCGVDVFWDGISSGRSAIGPLTAFDPTPYGCRVAGQIRDFNPRDFMPIKEVTSSSRVAQLAVASARLAVENAKLSLQTIDTSRIGVFIGSSVGTAEYYVENHAVFLEKGIRRVHPLFPAQAYPGVVATQAGIALGVRGPSMSISTACTSAADAIGIAFLQIRGGLLDRAVVGGAEAPLTPLIFSSFDRLGVMSRMNEAPERASRPFATDRDGFVMSEGSAACILETEESALERGATVLGELAGYGATSDGFHAFFPLPSGEEGVRAIQMALTQADLSAGDIDYVSAHAIGSKPNDPIEVEILRLVFGEAAPRVPVSSIKSMLGHSMGAAGALELISSVQTIRHSLIPPTINVDATGSLGGLDYVAEGSRARRVRSVLSPTFGFGSRNAALVIREYGADVAQ